MENHLEQQEQQRIAKEKRKVIIKRSITAAICLTAAVLLFVYIIRNYVEKCFGGYEVLASTERQDSSNAEYKSYNGNVLKISRDGAVAIGADGTLLWNGSYDYNSPQVDQCGNYVVIGDIGTKYLTVYNGNDSGTQMDMNYPIVQAEVSSKGIVAAVLTENASNTIQICDPYDNTQSLRVEIPTNVSVDGYPVDIALSPDGQKLITSYLTSESNALNSNVTFYNFDKVGQDKVNRIVGANNYKGKMIPKVEWINEDTACVFGEDFFTIYDMPELPKEVCTEEFKTTIKSIMYSEKYIGVVVEGEDNKEGILHVYNTSGREILSKAIDFEYSEVEMYGDEIYFRSALESHIWKVNGKVKLNYKSSTSIDYIFPTEGKNNYIFLQGKKILKVRLSGDGK
ncbi:MAG: DUF5711 family protein [Lachnospiraceae bacterium]|nr:DUF5711 family protein [Lachnospiraceae bacterium]